MILVRKSSNIINLKLVPVIRKRTHYNFVDELIKPNAIMKTKRSEQECMVIY